MAGLPGAGLAAMLMVVAQGAMAEIWQYRVGNSSATCTHGLYTNDVYYAPQCTNPASKSCLPREHFFSFEEAILTVDFDAGTATLRGAAKANKSDNQMRWDLQVDFSGMSDCSRTDTLRWPSSWGKTIPGLTPANPPQDDPLRNAWHCFRTMSGHLTDTISGDEVGVRLVGAQQPLQLGVGANGVLKQATGGFVRFLSSDGTAKTWEFGMQLTHAEPVPPPPEPTRFQIVYCPGTDAENPEDPGDPDIDGTAGRTDCSIYWYGEDNQAFVTTINGEPQLRGTITLDALLDIVDPRAHCGFTGPASSVPAYLEQLAPDATGRRGLRIHLASGDVDVPSFLCGIPGADGQPLFRLINADTDFSSDPSFRDVTDSVVEHEVEDPANPLYACGAIPPFQPVVAWLPRSDEIPILDAGGNEVRQIRDVTNGCGSYRGGSDRLSYLLSNLVYAPQLTPRDYHAIIRAELDAIETTLVQSTACIDAPQSTLSVLFPDLRGENGQSRLLDHIVGNFDAGNYRNVLAKLDWLLAELRDGGSLRTAFTQCYANTDGQIFDAGTSAPVPNGYAPRNFRGDLEAQILHVIYNIQEKEPAKPDPSRTARRLIRGAVPRRRRSCSAARRVSRVAGAPQHAARIA